jgi:hypothetical protein
MKKSLYCLISILLPLAFAGESRGANYTAASTSSSDVQAAINSASPGDTVIVPSGAATWNGTVSISTGITLVGGGNTNGVTTITQGGSAGTILNVSVSSGNCTVKGFNWVEVNNDSVTASFIQLEGTFYRFCSNSVTCTSGLTVNDTDTGQGLIDHNNFLFENDGINIFGTGIGSNAWNYGTTYGTTNYVYIEHNVFNTTDTTVYEPDGVLDAYAGAKFVLRYNLMTNGNWGWHGTDSGGYRSTHSYEIYGNTDIFTGANPPYWGVVFNSRGGTGLIFSNSIIGWLAGSEGHVAFAMQYFRLDLPSDVGSWGAFPNSLDGYISGQSPTGYQGLDQQGWTGPTTFFATHSTQVQSPTYIWGNTGMSVDGSDSLIQLGRDYFMNAPPFSYTPLPDPYPIPGATSGSGSSNTNPPQITTQPSNVSVTVGQPAAFSLAANGTTPLAYRWYFNSAAISGATNSSYTIAAAVTNNAGNYMAIVTNNYGSVTSALANLTVTSQQTQTQTVHYYYVATTGSDTGGNGSINSPWATVDYATSKMSGGDFLYIRGGVYSQIFDIYGPSGSSSYPTTVEAYPGETPIFNANNVSGGAHTLDGLNWFIMNGLTIMSNNIGLVIGYGGSCSNIVFSNMTINDIGQQGLQVENDSYNILIVSNTISNTGLWIYNGEGMYLGQGDAQGIMDNTHNVTVSNCIIYNTKDEGIELKPGTHDFTIVNNTIYTANLAQDPYGAGGGAIEVDEEGTYNYWSANPNHIVHNNLVYNTPIGIRAGNGGEYYNNIVYSVTLNGILINNNDNDSYSRYVYNNTVDASTSIAIVNNGATASILNNIGPTGTYNLATSNAYFVNEATHNYNLVAGSAPIQAGTNLFNMVQTDFSGNARPASGPFDIGAYQYGLVPLPPTALTATNAPSQ